MGDPVLAGHLGLGTAFNDNSGDDQASFRHQPTLAEPARRLSAQLGRPAADGPVDHGVEVGRRDAHHHAPVTDRAELLLAMLARRA